MNGNPSEIQCPNCGHQFPLGETFRAHYEEERRKAVAAALERARAENEEQEQEIRRQLAAENQEKLGVLQEQLQQQQATQAQREAEIRAAAEREREEQLAVIQQREVALQEQLQQQQAAQAQREAEIREAAEREREEQLAVIQQREAALQEQLRQQQAAQAQREAEIREAAEREQEEQLAVIQQREVALQEQLQQQQAAQAQREAEIRAAAEREREEQLAVIQQREVALQEQLQQQQATQAQREAEIRETAEREREEQLAVIQQREVALQEQLQQQQAEYAQREVLIRSQEEERFAFEREQHNIEKDRFAKAAAEAQANIAELRRKLQQGSVELQGEALEVYLKRKLGEEFPFDQIEDIGRGQLGADLKQEVRDAQLGSSGCGLIVWEAKNTMNWNDGWLDKIKDDANRLNAQVRVIVSKALPKDMSGVFELRERVWVSSVEGAIPLAMALRAQLVESARLQRAVQGKGLKMDQIYGYLTSKHFSERIKRMVETWNSLEQQVGREERAMQKQWKERRKQLAHMQETVMEMYTDFSAILGREIAQVPGLDLDGLLPAEGESTG